MRKKFKINLSTINYCNYSCVYCNSNIPYNHEEPHQYIDYKLLHLMVYNINKYLKDYDILYTLNEGEPTLHPYINEVISVLARTNNIKRLRLLTNSSLDLSKILKYTYPLEVWISVHYQQLVNHGFNKSLDMILHNIEYILQYLNSQCILSLLVNDEFPIDMQKFILDKYAITIKKLGSKPNYTKEIITPTENYPISNYNYNQLDNVYNRYGEEVAKDKIVYPYRGINISTQFNYKYICKTIRSKKDNEHTNILLHRAWNNIVQNLDMGIICNNQQCRCAVCLHTENVDNTSSKNI